MTAKRPLFILGWFGTAAAAFYLGQQAAPAPVATELASQRNGAVEVLVADRSGSESASATASSMLRPTQAGGLTPEALKSSIASLVRNADPLERTKATLAFLENLPASQIQEAVEQFRALGVTRERFDTYALLLASWAKSDPETALAYTQEKTRGRFSSSIVLSTWATKDPDAALAWARSKAPEGDEANPYLASVIRGLSGTDLPRATSLLQELPFSRERGRALDSVMASVLEQGTNAAKDWVQNITDPRLKAGAASRIAERMTDDPRAGLEWAGSISQETLTRSANRLVGSWMDEDKGTAMNWVREQPEAVQLASTQAVAEKMPVEEAREFLIPFLGKPEVNRALGSMVDRLQSQDPAEALDWAMNITNNRWRNRNLDQIINPWVDRSPAEAAAYLESNDNISPETRRRIERRLK